MDAGVLFRSRSPACARLHRAGAQRARGTAARVGRVAAAGRRGVSSRRCCGSASPAHRGHRRGRTL
ncbi:MAG: hypothetical protein DMF98_06020 [Acidobacteria bacterium]|nr:MAG: hypothetical protein DMF98_06020 [Acidobacteriota bacterium]